MRVLELRAVFKPLVFALIVASCSTQTYRDTNVRPSGEPYNSEFPDRPSSKALEQISRSVCSINCIGSYRVYPFDENEHVLRSDVNEQLLQRNLPNTYFSDNSVQGTATVISNDGTKICFITCAHVVNLPDTVVAYHVGPNGRATKYVRSVAVKVKQFNFISPFPEDGSVEVVAIDSEKDIAILGKRLQSDFGKGVAPIPCSLGDAKELNWGTFVYVFSYPAGVRMVTRAIVSNPHKDTTGSFYIDAVLNQGSSGGVVLAIRGGIPNFEVVGIVRIVPARFSYFLAPEDSVALQYDRYTPFEGKTFVRKRTDIETGVTKCIPAEVVRAFLDQNKDQMARQGYDCSVFLKSD